MRRKVVALSAICALLVVCTACPVNPKNLEKKKAAVLDIQKVIDGTADTLSALVVARAITPQEAGEIAKLLLPVNGANRALIDAAWNNDPSISGKLKVLDAAVNAFVSSGVIVRNLQSQSAIRQIADTLLRDVQILKR